MKTPTPAPAPGRRLRAPALARALAASLALLAAPFARSQEQARSADALVESMAICTHFRYNNIYDQPNWPALKAKLADLGIRYVRDGASANEGHVLDYYKSLHTDHGIKTIMSVTNKAGIQLVLPSQVPGMITNNNRLASIEAVEGPNEVDLFDIDYTGADRWQRTRNYMIDLKAALSGNPATAGIPIIAPAMANADADRNFNNDWRIAPIGDYVDYANIHYYTSGNYPGWGGYLDAWKYNRADKAFGSGPTKPYYATEGGFSTALGDHRGVSETAQATYVLRMFAEHFKEGIFRTALYELMDEGPSNNNYEHKLGIVRDNFSNKPAFTALKNFISLLQEPGSSIAARRSAGQSFLPGKLDYAAVGTPTTANVDRLLLQKSDGSFHLLLWQRTSSFNLSSKTDINVPAVNLTFRVGTPLSSATRYTFNDNGSMATHSVTLSNGQFTVPVTDRITVVRLVPSGSALGTTGGVRQEVWTGIPGTSLSAIPVNNPPSQTHVLTQLQGTQTGNDYGSRIRGFITAPSTGRYTFFFTSDDQGEFWLSNTELEQDLTRLARVDTWLGFDSWVSSEPRWLVKGERYYFTALQKQGGGGGHVRVQWQGPGVARQTIPASALLVDHGYPYRDDFNNLNGIHSRSSNWAIDTASSSRHGGDGARLRRTVNGNEHAVFQLANLRSFTARIHYGTDWGNGLDYSKLRFLASSASTGPWTEIAASARVHFGSLPFSWGYDIFEPVGTLPVGTNFLRIEFNQGLNVAVNYYDQSYGLASAQLSYLTLVGGGAAAPQAPGFGTGYYRIVARHSGKALDVKDAGTANGAAVHQRDYVGGLNQQWQILDVGGGYHRIIARHSGKALDVKEVSTSNGGLLHQWDYVGGHNQQWRVIDVGGGYHRIEARHSGKVLDVFEGRTTNGAAIHQWDWFGGHSQQWQLVPVQ